MPSSLEIALASVKLSSGTRKSFLRWRSPGSLEAWGWKARSKKYYFALQDHDSTANYLL